MISSTGYNSRLKMLYKALHTLAFARLRLSAMWFLESCAAPKTLPRRLRRRLTQAQMDYRSFSSDRIDRVA